jgi:hypothetical protein
MRPLETPRHRWGDNPKADLIRNMMQGHGLNSSDSEQGQVMGSQVP